MAADPRPPGHPAPTVTIPPDTGRADVDSPAIGHRDEGGGTRIRRLLARFVGAGYAAYLVSAIVESGRQTAPVRDWWTPAAVALAVVPGLVLLAASFGSGAAAQRWRRTAAVWAVVGYAVAAVSWLAAWTGDGVADSSTSTWLVRFSGLAGLCAALVFRPVQAILVQAVATAAASVINQTGLISARPLWPRILTETLWAWGFSGVFVAAAVMAVHTSRVLDATESSVTLAAATTAARTARARERTKFDALLHDRVIAVLLDAARTTTPHRLPAQARSALSALDELSATTGSDTADIAVDVVVERLRSTMRDLDPAVEVSHDREGDAAARYPGEVVRAILDAAAEAVRNSLLHAEGDAPPTVAMTANSDRLRVVITDRGRGFDPSAVDPGRLGVVRSIAGAMGQIPGGRSQIVTALGEGTSVRLGWDRPELTSTPATSPNHRRSPTSTRRQNRSPDPGIADVVGLRSRWTVTVSGVFLACAAVAAAASITAGMQPASALASLTLLALGVGAVALPAGDVLGRRWTAVCAASAPLQIVAAAAGLAEPISDPVANAASVSGGLVVCGFLCVRGRVGAAWLVQALSWAIYVWWVIGTGSDLSAVAQVVVPSTGVMVMATVFAALLRPAAQEIFVLRAARTRHAAETAAVDAAMDERLTQIARLDGLARPALDRICENPTLSSTDRHTMLLLEARLRDSIRARALDTPALTDAVWNARARGATVSLFDEGALNDVGPDTVALLIGSITDHVDTADAGMKMTIRIAPPHREYLATITITTASGHDNRYEFDHTGAPLAAHNDIR
ncbi:ATP-binding protein [Rhodococcoides fascians]|uniref:ATP-binding protein n=1 Tax=Rhodococcoides fascians TaxID=1828 RepID=UPI00068BF9C0|nr:ATP-binding protein [Rhodococcus fascians]